MFAGPASAAVSVTQTESADPVAEGTSVTYTVTLTNTGAQVDNARLTVQTMKSTDESPVENPYLSLTSTQGSCALNTGGGFTGGQCAIGALAGGASVQVVGTVQADFSMQHVASLASCDATGEFCFPQTSSSETTTVTHAPTFSGSKKIKVTGLPAQCASSTFKAKAKAGASGVKSVAASISGPRDEFGIPASGFKPPKQLAKQKGKKVKAKVQGATLPDGYYELAFLALRKGSPNLKRTVTFQVC